MYVNVYKAKPYSYVDRNFRTITEAMGYLHISEKELQSFIHTLRLNFCEHEGTGEIYAMCKDWRITLIEGDMPNEGEGFVDMLYESGAMEDVF